MAASVRLTRAIYVMVPLFIICLLLNLFYTFSVRRYDIEGAEMRRIMCPTDLNNLKHGINKTPSAKTNTRTAIPTEKKAVDMVNDYEPFVDFRFIYPHIFPRYNDSELPYLVVFVNSAARGDEYRERRRTIRQTWANHNSCEQQSSSEVIKALRWQLVFALGEAGDRVEDEKNLEEASKYNDIIIGKIPDNYINNILKLYMGFIWSTVFRPKYILKTDDDSYVSIPRSLEYIWSIRGLEYFYGGETYDVSHVMRWAGGRWSVSEKYYPEKTWPKFNAGALYVISTNLVPRLCEYTKQRLPFHTDDAYIGVAMRDLGINVTDIPSFDIQNNMNGLVEKWTNCELLKLTGYAHNLYPGGMRILHKRLEDMCKKNISKVNCA